MYSSPFALNAYLFMVEQKFLQAQLPLKCATCHVIQVTLPSIFLPLLVRESARFRLPSVCYFDVLSFCYSD